MSLKNKIAAAVVLAAGSLLSMTASAAVNGFYAGAQMGYADTGYTAHNLGLDGTDASVDSNGIAGGVFAGYQLNPYFAVQGGYTKFSDADIKHANLGLGFEGHGKVEEQAFDLVGKGILPLQKGFSLYGDAGMAVVLAKAKMTVDGNTQGVTFSDTTSNDKTKILPTFGVGVSYDLTPKVPVSLGWTRIQKMGGNSIQSVDMGMVSVAYHFA